jgi:hypothetical protein
MHGYGSFKNTVKYSYSLKTSLLQLHKDKCSFYVQGVQHCNTFVQHHKLQNFLSHY